METQNLTDEEINRKVAELMGWKWVEGVTVYSLAAMGSIASCDGWLCPIRGIGSGDYDPPRFSTSLDACATFEANITDRRAYNMNLESSVREDKFEWYRLDPEDRYFEVVTATPRQRCIAFLRMKGVL